MVYCVSLLLSKMLLVSSGILKFDSGAVHAVIQYVLIVFHLISLGSLIVGSAILIINSAGHVNAEAFVVFISGLKYLANYVVAISRRNEIAHLVENVDNLLRRRSERAELKLVVRKMSRICTRVTYAILIDVMVTIFLAMSYSCYTNFFTEGKKALLFEFATPFDQFTVNLFFQTLASVLGTGCFVSVTACKICLVLSLACLLETLRIQLKTVRPETIREIYSFHFQTVNCCSKVNDLLGITNIFEYSCSIAVLGFCVQKLTQKVERGEADDIFKTLGILVTTLVWPFIVCLCGTQLMTENEKVMTAAYQNNWYLMNARNRRDLAFLTLMATKRIGLHYRLSIYFDMETFARLVKWTYSFIAVLQSKEN